ncbi:MAG: prepilin-type N-terminal cleavage/methylation domain-containing protein [Oscillospiraceae bacterium]
MKKNSKGFTLVELMVSLLIFGIVVAAAAGFMVAGSKSYNSVNDALNLQMQSQLTANHITEYIIDSSAGIAFNSSTNTLYIINEYPPIPPDTDPTYTAHVFKYADGKINYGKGSARRTETDVDGKKQISFNCSVDPADLLTENVKAFSISLKKTEQSKVTSAELSITLEKRGKVQTTTRTIALRNCPPMVEIG